jgi:hypothetical protein
MQFKTVREYLHALERDRAMIAVVTIPMAAEFRGVSRAAIVAMLDKKKLEEIRVGKTRYVRAQSLIDLMNREEDEVSTVKRLLERRAREQEIVFYRPVMAAIDRSPTIPADRGYIGGVLAKISEQTKDEHKVLLSVIVHKKTLGRTGPGEGFFELARSLGYKWEDEKRFVDQELKKVWRVYAA